MTREDAYYLKMLLLSDFRAEYEEELNGFLEAEEPISDIALKLAFLGSDTEKAIYELHCYALEEGFDEDAVCDRLRLFLKKAYHSGQMCKEEIVDQMYRFVMQYEELFESDSDYWYCMYIMDDASHMAESGMISREDFDTLFFNFLNEGTLFQLPK